MQQTEKYKFNIIDPSDAFGPEKLNENAQKLEDALIAHKAETDAALASQKAAADAALAKHETSETARVNAVQDSVKFVKLGEVAAKSANQAMAFSLSGLDMNSYAALFVVGGGQSSNNLAMVMNVNGQKVTDFAVTTTTKNYAASMNILLPVGNCTVLLNHMGRPVSGSTSSYAGGGVFDIVWSKITEISLSGVYYAGAWAALYGFKK